MITGTDDHDRPETMITINWIVITIERNQRSRSTGTRTNCGAARRSTRWHQLHASPRRLPLGQRSTHLRFLGRCFAAGITAPIVPGIMAVSNYAQAAKFSAMCGTTVPAWLGHMFEGIDDDPEQRRS